MHIITQKRIWDAKAKWPHSATALDTWHRLIKSFSPADFAAMRKTFPATDKVGALHVFDIGGNKLRLIAAVDYRFQKVFIQTILTHSEYDRGQWKR